jgi:hypothetical protein
LVLLSKGRLLVRWPIFTVSRSLGGDSALIDGDAFICFAHRICGYLTSCEGSKEMKCTSEFGRIGKISTGMSQK